MFKKVFFALIIIIAVILAFAYYSSAFSIPKVNPPLDNNPPESPKTQTKISIYFSNGIKNPNISDCSAVYPVTRTVEQVPAIGRLALTELLKGPTPQEKSAGYTSELNPMTKVNSLSIKDSVAYVDFDSQLDAEVAGSCRVAMIRAQIEATLKQFPTVTSVVISRNGQVDDILQP